jgi:hypothetical protein
MNAVGAAADTPRREGEEADRITRAEAQLWRSIVTPRGGTSGAVDDKHATSKGGPK